MCFVKGIDTYHVTLVKRECGKVKKFTTKRRDLVTVLGDYPGLDLKLCVLIRYERVILCTGSGIRLDEP